MRTASEHCFNNAEKCSCYRAFPGGLWLLFTEELNRGKVKQLRAGWASDQQPQQEEAGKGRRGEGDFGASVWSGGLIGGGC